VDRRSPPPRVAVFAKQLFSPKNEVYAELPVFSTDIGQVFGGMLSLGHQESTGQVTHSLPVKAEY
jgi:hypothetical protein